MLIINSTYLRHSPTAPQMLGAELLLGAGHPRPLPRRAQLQPHAALPRGGDIGYLYSLNDV